MLRMAGGWRLEGEGWYGGGWRHAPAVAVIQPPFQCARPSAPLMRKRSSGDARKLTENPESRSFLLPNIFFSQTRLTGTERNYT